MNRSWGGHSLGDGARAQRIANAIARAMDARACSTGIEACQQHEDARSITARAPRGKFSRTRRELQVRPPGARGVAMTLRAAIARGDRAHACVAPAACKSRRRRRKTQTQGMLVDPVVNRMLWT
jgi:hypothetical protein